MPCIQITDIFEIIFAGSFTNWCLPSFDKHTFNTGSMLIVPSLYQFQALVHGINTIQHDTVWGDQSYLNVFYESTTFELPFAYNGQASSIVCEPRLWHSAKIVHFTIEKPWYGHKRIDVHGIRPYRILWDELLNKMN